MDTQITPRRITNLALSTLAGFSAFLLGVAAVAQSATSWWLLVIPASPKAVAGILAAACGVAELRRSYRSLNRLLPDGPYAEPVDA